MYTIAIITSEYSLHNIMKIDGFMRRQCKITYLPYSSTEHLISLYQENASAFDGLLFSGSFPYHLILRHFGSISRPASCFTVTAQDHYRIIAKIAIHNPGIDFSRVFFDIDDMPNGYRSVFRDQKYPVFGTFAKSGFSRITREPSAQYFLKLWNSGKFDLIVTRFSSLREFFDRNNIRYELLLASQESMQETFLSLLMQLSNELGRDSATCVGIVSAAKYDQTGENLSSLLKELKTCNKNLGNIFLIYEHDNHYELTTNSSSLKELTRQYSFCPVCFHLNNTLTFPVFIGWGCQESITDAYKNAQRALKEAMQTSMTSSYIATSDNILIGPLSNLHKKLTVDTDQEQVAGIHSRSGIDSRHIRNILLAVKKTKKVTFTAKELSLFLDLSPRNTSRILNTLEETGFARSQDQHTPHHKGRPVKAFTLSFSDGI